MLCVVDEFTREALAIRVARKLSSSDVIDALADLFIAHGTPTHIRSDQGPQFIADAVKTWIAGVGSQTAYIEKASPWENGYVESFNGKLRDELNRPCGVSGLADATSIGGVRFLALACLRHDAGPKNPLRTLSRRHSQTVSQHGAEVILRSPRLSEK